MYSIIPILHPYQNSKGEHLITLQVLVDGSKLNVKTKFRVKEAQFKSGKVIKHELAEKYNFQITKQRLEIENKLLDALKHQSKFSKPELDVLIRGKVIAGNRFIDFAEQLTQDLKSKLSPGRLRKYNTVINKVRKFHSAASLQEIDSNWLTRFENYCRKDDNMNSTISSNIKVIKRMVRLAKKEKLISTFDFSDYENIKVKYREPDFLTEDELKAFAAAIEEFDKPIIKIPGYYFLLSCYTGFRIGDALRFNYKAMVRHGEVLLDAEKNDNRSGVPLFPALVEVIEFITHNPCKYHQKTVRESVKLIAVKAGIDKYVKYHTSRHTFCTRMLQMGFTIPEVAAMAGDSVATISKTYAHVDKKNLKSKVKALLG